MLCLRALSLLALAFSGTTELCQVVPRGATKFVLPDGTVVYVNRRESIALLRSVQLALR